MIGRGNGGLTMRASQRCELGEIFGGRSPAVGDKKIFVVVEKIQIRQDAERVESWIILQGYEVAPFSQGSAMKVGEDFQRRQFLTLQGPPWSRYRWFAWRRRRSSCPTVSSRRRKGHMRTGAHTPATRHREGFLEVAGQEGRLDRGWPRMPWGR